MKPNEDPRFADADVPPMVIRAALNLAHKRGISTGRLCKGLGFEPDDLGLPDIRVSYRQTSQLVRRAQLALRDPAMGLAAGSAQTVVSWGLAGMGMLTCRTLGDAVAFSAEHQIDAGALLLHKTLVNGKTHVLEVAPRFFDPDLEPYLVEEAFSSIVSILRSLVGARYSPVRVELAYPKPKYAAAYSTVFNCAVRFGATINRMVDDTTWLRCELPSYDPYSSDSVRAQIESLMVPRNERKDLLESASTYLRTHVEEARGIDALAQHLSLSERTLRRRLSEMKVSYRGLVDRARYERSLELLSRTNLSVGEIALATGFGDARNFRRAFKRWSGGLPSDVRSELRGA